VTPRIVILAFLLAKSQFLYGQTTDELNAKATEYAKAGEMKKALKEIDRSLKLDPNKKETYLTAGLINFVNKDFEKAESNWSKAIQIDSFYVDAFDYLAAVYFELKDFKRGLIYLDRAIELQPTIRRFQGRADLRGMARDYQGTIEDCNEILRLEPSNAKAYSTRANAKFGLKDRDGACSDLRKAIELGMPRDSFYIKYCEN